MTLISNNKLEGEKKEKNWFFCKLNIKDQWHSYIYNDNTNIYIFIKER